MKLKIIDFVKRNKKELIVLCLILLIGAFFRLYKISSYMTFLGDEGRDVIIVRRLLVEGHPPLIGPGTSVGNMYLGPLYYYMMAPALLLANFSPVGPAVMVATLGVITIAFVWWVVRKWFPDSLHIGALIAAFLYAISPTIIYFSRSSWNPNIMPFFALLSVYSIWKVWKERKFNWLIVIGISYAFILQSHYLGLLLAPTLFLFWILTFLKVKKTDFQKPFIKKSIFGLISFLILMSPLLFFDIRHNWINTKAMYAFFIARQATISTNPLTATSEIPALFNQINLTLVGGKNVMAGNIISVLFVIALIALISNIVLARKKKLHNINPAYYLLVSWFGFALIGLGLYKQNIYDHYFGFIFVVPFIIIGAIASRLGSGGKLLKILGILVLGYLITINLITNPLLKEPNKLMQRSIDVSKVIERESGRAPFNLAVIADNNYEAGYEYFLLKDNYPVIEIDAQIPGTITNQLFAVCEIIPNSKCDPTHNPKAQIASFGWSKIESSWNVDGTIVYKLIHSK